MAFRAPRPDFFDFAAFAPRFSGVGAAADDVSTTFPPTVSVAAGSPAALFLAP
jgi:hypothetical protein